MKNNKYFLAAILGGVAYFLLGWIIYGMLLMKFMTSHSGLPADIQSKVFRPQAEMNMGLMIVSNLLYGFLMATILNWGNARSAMAGAKMAGIVGLLVAASFDLMFYSMSYMYTPIGLITDIIAAAVWAGLGGAVVGWILGKGK
jgi:hypothetical protein